jgi:ABC-2 type transport system ATP-binding protein
MIRVENLVFEYPGVRALDNVSFSVAPGSITALVGPNGAGKTTLLRCLAALDSPLSGRALIDGIDVQEEPRTCHAKVGYLSDSFGLYQALTVRQCLMHVALSQRLAPADAASAVTRTAAQVGLQEKLESRAGELSRGQRQRVAIGQAIIHRPKVILLDEPASGLDPEARHALAELFLALRDQGMTLFVSSHILAELEEYSTAMLVLRQGRIVEHAEIGSRHHRTHLRIRIAAPVPPNFDWTVLAGLEVLTVDDGEITAVFSGDAGGRHELLKQLLAHGLMVYGFEEERVNLQDAYLATVRAPQ